VEPQTGFDPLFDLSIVLMAFLGGLGTVAGPVLGALIIEPGQLYLTIRFTNGYYGEILLGTIFLVVVLLVPRGIIPTGGEWIRRLMTRGRSAIPPAYAPQAPGRVPRGPEGPQRRPGAEDQPPEASEAPAREANR
jgi:branched-chain amino acid transport system permease protein